MLLLSVVSVIITMGTSLDQVLAFKIIAIATTFASELCFIVMQTAFRLLMIVMPVE